MYQSKNYEFHQKYQLSKFSFLVKLVHASGNVLAQIEAKAII